MAVKPRVLGSGSFSDVLEMTHEQQHTKAALKVYQRIPKGGSQLFEKERFDRELAILSLLGTTPASVHVPQIVLHNAELQYMLLTPIGECLTERHMNRHLIINLVAAVRAVHEFCIHRDLRAGNIIVVHDARPQPTVRIIDWNLGLPLEDLAHKHKPEGAWGVQGFGVLDSLRFGHLHRYSQRDDLQSLVRAVYLVYNRGVARVLDAECSSEGRAIAKWISFWEHRLQQRVPPVGPEDSVWYWWMVAEARACAGDYDGVQDALLRVL